MKTPREILLERHQMADRELASIQARVLARPAWPKIHEMPAFIFQKLWTELFHPLRFAWGGFAAVWLVLWIANFQLSDHLSVVVADAKHESPAAILMARKEQEAVLTELIEPQHHAVADRPRVSLPKPQSRRVTFISIG